MAQEFTIKSERIEDKINQLLPSQGGFGAGVDLSASTMVIPIIDVTETAEGSSLRQDLQTSFDIGTSYTAVTGAGNTDLSLTAGFYRVQLTIFRSVFNMTSAFIGLRQKELSSGTYTNIIGHTTPDNSANDLGVFNSTQEFNVFLRAGYDLNIIIPVVTTSVSVSTRQIATTTGDLVNPNGF